MTLVVAKITSQKDIILCSDTKLTYSVDAKRKLEDGIIKSVILSRNICISFAGIVQYAEEALKEIDKCLDTETITKILNKWNKISNYETDFIFCTGHPQPKIILIKNRVCEEVKNAWIGNYDAFKSFQGFMKFNKQRDFNSANQTMMLLTEPDNEELDEFCKAMSMVFTEEHINDVGGLFVPIVYKNGEFRYAEYLAMYSGLKERYEIKGEGNKSMPMNFPATSQKGGYNINLFTGKGLNILAVHIYEANIGLIYRQNESYLMKPEVIKLRQFDFFDYCVEKFNFEEPKAYIGERKEQFGYKGDEAMQNGDFLKAIEYYSKFINIDKGFVGVFYNRALAHFSIGDISNAISDFKYAIQLAPDDLKVRALINLGEISIQMKEEKEASAYFSKAIEIEPLSRENIMFILNKYNIYIDL